MYEMVQRLDDQHRIPVILKYLNDFAEKDIADMMELNVNTVKSRLFKARKKLKEWMLQNRGGNQHGT
ncbi:sigma factor-like helix-turn-helix DNA-binding protein [Yersinia pestis]|nr:sigma factor-like helix-turn-helix DNA-binding protein [Yersinia pestis]